VFSLRHRMMQCVLSPARAAAQAVVVLKVDQHAPPPPEEDVHAVEEPPHHQIQYKSFLISLIGMMSVMDKEE
jgi:hypothetical protein